jgi:MYXO-CTERM domain-containing protein
MHLETDPTIASTLGLGLVGALLLAVALHIRRRRPKHGKG